MKPRRWRKGWKVCSVEKESGEYRSMACYVKGVYYVLNEPTQRPEDWGPLVVFNSLKAAEQAYEHMGRVLEPSMFALFECLWFESDDIEVWDGNYKYLVKDLESDNEFLIPGTTRLADKVILKKRLDNGV